MPENFHYKADSNMFLTENQKLEVKSLLGRLPTEHEIEVIAFLLFKTRKFDDFKTEKNIASQTTDNNQWVLRSELVELNPKEETENTSAASTLNLISKILKKNACPIAIVNSFNIDEEKVDDGKKFLQQVIKGTSKVSNVLGIPNLKTDVLFHRGSQYLHSAALGLSGNKPQSNTFKFKNCNIYLLGRYQSSVQEKNNGISGYHYKFIKEVIEELINTKTKVIIENIEDGGIINSLVQITKIYAKGIHLDITGLFKELTKQNFSSLLNPQFSSIIVIAEDETKLKEIAAKWELNCLVIGQIEAGQNLNISFNGKQLTNLPVNQILINKNIFFNNEINESVKKPAKKINLSKIKFPKKIRDAAWFLISAPNIVSKSCINEQYDSMVGISTMNTSFPSDSNVFNLKGTNRALAVCLSNKNNYINGSIELAAQIALAELSRKMVCSGAKPVTCSADIVVTDSINSENLLKSIEQTAKGLNFSVNLKIKNNTSNETQHIQSFFSMLGLIEDKNHQMTMSFKDKGNIIFLIGTSSENLTGSEYLISYHKDTTDYLPDFDIEQERKVNQAILELIGKNLICSAHNISKGGLFISLVESAMIFGFGFDIITDTDIRTDAFLFGESPGRVTVSVTPNKEDKFIDFMMQKELPFLAIGHVTKGEMRVDDISYGFIDDAKEKYNNALKRFLNKDF